MLITEYILIKLIVFIAFSADKIHRGLAKLVLINSNLPMKVKIVFIPAKEKIHYFQPYALLCIIY